MKNGNHFLACLLWLSFINEVLYWKLFCISIVLMYTVFRKDVFLLVKYIVILVIILVLQNINSGSNEVINGRVIEVKEKYVLIEHNFNKYIVYDEAFNYDDVVEVRCNVDKITSMDNRAGFNYEVWSKHKGIVGSCTSVSSSIIKRGNTLRNVIYQQIESMPKDTKAVMKMFLLKEHDSSNAYFSILLSSGIHVAMLISMFRKVLRYFFDKDSTEHIVILVAVFLCLIYNFSFFTLRILIRIITKYLVNDKREAWGIYAILLMVIYRGYVLDVVLIYSLTLSFISSFSYRRRILSSSIVICLLQLIINGFFSIKQYVLSQLVRPVFSFVYVLCIMRIWLNFDRVFIKINELVSLIINSESSDPLVLIGKPHPLIVASIIILLVFYQRYSDNSRLTACMWLLVLNNFQCCFRPYAKVVYIDVGQGDSTLVSLPFNKGNFLIDTGGSTYKDIAKDILYPVLSSYGIRDLDAVIITHDDIDHAGGLESLSSLIEIDEVITQKNNIYSFENIQFYDFLSEYEFEDGNANSLITYFDIYGTRFLILGDIGKEQESILINERGNFVVDVLKVAHHGSKTSTSDKLLTSTKPRLSIISAGENNRYGHPSTEVIERLRAYKINYLSTTTSGAIEINIFPHGYFVYTFKKEFAIIINR